MKTGNYRVVDLFCGCGGFSKGFEQAGFELVLGLDSWQDALETYAANFRHAKTVLADINNITVEHIKTDWNLQPGEIDVIIGGPPCQGFSLSGKRLMDDPRNKLYKSYVEIVSFLRPKVFVMENVPGIVKLFDGKVQEEITGDFTKLGYTVNKQQLSAEQFGVPQQRKRVFFVGIDNSRLRNTREFPVLAPTHGSGAKPCITVKQAISDLDFIPDDTALDECIEYRYPAENTYQKKMRKGSRRVYNHVATLHTQKTKDIIAMVPDGGNYKNLPVELWQTRKVNIAWTRMNSEKPCFTIDTGHNHHFHYKENRVPTVRESARIQSFPDTFHFLGIKTSQLKQVGNAVPPLLAQALAREVHSILAQG